MRKPVCRLNVALYGHPDSGTDWESHCDQSLQKVAFQNVGGGAWPSCYFHKELGLLISVYVDDFKLAGPKANLEQGWRLITRFLELDPPQPLNLYLGRIHEKRTLKVEGAIADVMVYTMEDC